ncbi:MAG: hypothetical protein LBD74_06970 [Spirochaetaceae bacterium]|jgi:hypothetical protein|nr:hypothetical protein [Spirochaetaceae bacterium]
MKRLFVFLLLIGFAASSFALDVGEGFFFYGKVITGLRIDTEDKGDDSDKTQVYLFEDDYWVRFRSQLDFGYESEWGGYNSFIRADYNGGDRVGGYYLPVGWGWLNFFDKRIVVDVGDIYGHKWGLGNYINADDPGFDEGKGIRTEFKFIEGLSFGFRLPVWVNNTNFEDVFGGTVFGVVYKTDIFDVGGSMELTPETSWTEEENGTVKVKGTDDSYIKALFGVDVKLPSFGVPIGVGLNARYDSRKYNESLTNFRKNGYLWVGGKVETRFDDNPFKAYLKGRAVFQNELPDALNGITATSDLLGKLEEGTVVENLGDTAYKLEVCGEYKINDPINTFVVAGSDNLGYFDGNGIFVKAGFSIARGSFSIMIFDRLNHIGAKDIEASGNIDKHSPLKNEFQIRVFIGF